MYSLKPITAAGIGAALQKAERYRLLNDWTAADSICQDVLEIDPANQQALTTLLLAITDGFADNAAEAVARARDVLPRLDDEYKRHYYAGIICERRATALLRRGGPRAHEVADGWLREAMPHYERAERLRPAGNDEAILRWNACARLLNRSERLHPRVHEEFEPALE
ncbi:MAG TPA: hypothetical protein VL157_16265 [Gemmatimonadaceae bacterium]|jgi:hypothetical protein|nr:hypothetical protein [Gemmatimonadaceae bacterium]